MTDEELASAVVAGRYFQHLTRRPLLRLYGMAGPGATDAQRSRIADLVDWLGGHIAVAARVDDKIPVLNEDPRHWGHSAAIANHVALKARTAEARRAFRAALFDSVPNAPPAFVERVIGVMYMAAGLSSRALLRNVDLGQHLL